MFGWKKKKEAATDNLMEEVSADAEVLADADAAEEVPDSEETASKEAVSESFEPSDDSFDAASEENSSEDSEAADEPVTVSNEPEAEPKKKGFFGRLFAGLSKTRDSIASGIGSIFTGFSSIDDEFYEELEDHLIMADIGMKATMDIMDSLKEKVKEQKIKEPAACKELLIASIIEQMQVPEDAYDYENHQSVVMMIGVNGVGKTTTVGKIAGQMKSDGKRVVVAAADTFRAGAIDQLQEWTHRAGVELIAQSEGSDPAAVVFDAVNAAKARKADILLCDTAGRLHNKKNLMEELRKIDRVVERGVPDWHRETFVVLDGTTGQNALSQAKQFGEVANITGIVITKLDGTAKGGIAIAIQKELGIPVKYIGVGEHIEDLQKFDPESFVRALFD